MADPLFGAGIHLSGPWAAGFSAASRVRFLDAVRSVPRLTRFVWGLAWSADYRALLGALLSQLAYAVTGALGLVAVNNVLIGLMTSGPTIDRVRTVHGRDGGVRAAGGSLSTSIGLHPSSQPAANTC